MWKPRSILQQLRIVITYAYVSAFLKVLAILDLMVTAISLELKKSQVNRLTRATLTSVSAIHMILKKVKHLNRFSRKDGHKHNKKMS